MLRVTSQKSGGASSAHTLPCPEGIQWLEEERKTSPCPLVSASGRVSVFRSQISNIGVGRNVPGKLGTPCGTNHVGLGGQGMNWAGLPGKVKATQGPEFPRGQGRPKGVASVAMVMSLVHGGGRRNASR